MTESYLAPKLADSKLIGLSYRRYDGKLGKAVQVNIPN